MTTCAYEETYLDDAMNNLGDMLDYAVNDLGYSPEEFFEHFIISGVADSFEKGNPKYIAGMSGPELACEVIFRTRRTRPGTSPSESLDKSPEYWAGWIMAYYQWYSARRFTDMQTDGLSIDRVLSLYPTLHEADVTKFIAVADSIIEKNRALRPSKLKRIRKARGITQKELAESSGAALRMVQLYEQKRQDISKAQVATVTGLARVLGCEITDLLE